MKVHGSIFKVSIIDNAGGQPLCNLCEKDKKHLSDSDTVMRHISWKPPYSDFELIMNRLNQESLCEI